MPVKHCLPSAPGREGRYGALRPHLPGQTRKRHFPGPAGVGKTHLAIALAIKACSHGFRVCFTTMNMVICKLKESQSKGKAYLSASLVIVDEADYLPRRQPRGLSVLPVHLVPPREELNDHHLEQKLRRLAGALSVIASASSIGFCTTPGSSTSRATAIV
jgi:hypothetical protein